VGGEWPGEIESRILRDMHHVDSATGYTTPTRAVTDPCAETTKRSLDDTHDGLNGEALDSTGTTSPVAPSNFATGPSLNRDSTAPEGNAPARNATETKKAQIVCEMECLRGENMAT
jgi:hypothetical protein